MMECKAFGIIQGVQESKWQFGKKNNEANVNRLKEASELFKEEERKAKSNHLDEMVKLMDPKNRISFLR